MAFINGKKRSKLFLVTLVAVSMIASYAMPLSVYATEENPREPTSTEEALTTEPVINLTEEPSVSPVIDPSSEPSADEPVVEPSEDPSVDEPVVEPSEDPSVDEPVVEPSEDPSVDEPVVDPSQDPEQVLPAEPDLTVYVVEYVTAAGEKLLQDKLVEDQLVGIEVNENAEAIEGYSVDESAKSITLGEAENVITFVYSAVESTEEEIPPVEEELPPVEEEVPPVEEGLPPVVEIPVIEEEVVTEPAIVVEPTAATLTIIHRLIVGDESAEEIRVIDGLEVGQTLDLTEYLAPIDWVECIMQEKSITLELAENTVVLEYAVSEGADVSVVLEDGNAVLEQDAIAEIKTDDENAVNGIAQ